MGQKIRRALADRDAHYKLAGLIEMDDTYFGTPKPGQRGCGAASKAKVVVAVETPGNKPKFEAILMVSKISGQEIQSLVRERLVAEVIGKTDGWPGYTSWIPCPTVMSASFPVLAKNRRRSSLGAHLDRQYQRQYSWCPSWCQPKVPAPLPGGILLQLQPALLTHLRHQVKNSNVITIG